MIVDIYEVPGRWSPDIGISIIQKHFSTDLRWNATTKRFFDGAAPAEEDRYIDAPKEEVGKSWSDLMVYQYVMIEPGAGETKQFDQVDQDGLTDGEQGYFELSIFHNLNCLNALRKTIYKDRIAREGSNISLCSLQCG